MLTLLDAIQQRYASRQFTTVQIISTSELSLLREAGRLAPSAFGLEPWQFITVTDTAERTAIARACYDQPAAATASAFIVALVDALDPDSEYVRARFEAETRGQCNFAAGYILLQAAHLGLGSCPISGFDDATLSGRTEYCCGRVACVGDWVGAVCLHGTAADTQGL